MGELVDVPAPTKTVIVFCEYKYVVFFVLWILLADSSVLQRRHHNMRECVRLFHRSHDGRSCYVKLSIKDGGQQLGLSMHLRCFSNDELKYLISGRSEMQNQA